jgi:uracil-DNA glycosylase family 4
MNSPKRGNCSPAENLRQKIIKCRRCPRLTQFRERVKPRASYSTQHYWRRPVPGFGDLDGRLLVLGLAPALHGGNRTGRVFTGDSSGRFLIKALHAAGFANQPISESIDDGLVYLDCYLTAAVKCAPPGDRPTNLEFENCSVYLSTELALMKNLRAVLVLGAMAFNAYRGQVGLRRGAGAFKFAHGKKYTIKGGPTLYASYHPSPRNTNTGRLTEDMLVSVLENIRRDLNRKARI